MLLYAYKIPKTRANLNERDTFLQSPHPPPLDPYPNEIPAENRFMFPERNSQMNA